MAFTFALLGKRLDGAVAPACITNLFDSGVLAGSTYPEPYTDSNGDGFPDLRINTWDYSIDIVQRSRIYDPRNSYALNFDSNPSSSSTENWMIGSPYLALSNSQAIPTLDVDGDGFPDLLLYKADYDSISGGYTSTLRTVRGSDGVVTWTSSQLDGRITDFKSADLVGGPSAELILIYTANSTTWTSQVQVLNGTSKSLLFSRASPVYTNVSAAQDFDADGKSDLLIGASNYMNGQRENHTLVRPANAWQIVWQSNPSFDLEISEIDQPYDENVDGDGIVSPADIDADAVRELLVTREDQESPTATAWLEIRNALTYALEYSFPPETIGTGFTGAFLDQLDGDPAMEVAFMYRNGSGSNYTSIKIYDGATKALQWSYEPMDGRAFYAGMSLDLNENGSKDLVLVEWLAGGGSNARVLDIALGGTVVYQTNPGEDSTLASTLIAAPSLGGGPIMRQADVGGDGVQEILQVDTIGGSRVARLLTLPSYTEIWNSSAFGYNLDSAGIFNLDPNVGDEIILVFEDNNGSDTSSTVKVLGCLGSSGTPTPTRTPAPPSATPSHTPTVTRTFTPLPGSPTDSPTQSPSFTPSPSYTASPTLTPSATPSATPTISPTPSVSPTHSATFTITPAFTPALYDASAGALAQLKPVFNPIRGDVLEIYIELGASAEALDVELYSPAMVLIKRERFSLSLAGARSRHRIDASGLAGGPFFARVAVQNAKGEAGHKVLRLYKVP